jgi:hypothetical protein
MIWLAKAEESLLQAHGKRMAVLKKSKKGVDLKIKMLSKKTKTKNKQGGKQ